MKLITLLFAVLLCFTAPAFSELTPADIDKIRLIVKEEVEAVVEASETRMKDHISGEIKAVNITIAEMDKRLNQIFTLVIALVAFIAVVIGIPQILVALQRRDIRAQVEKIEAQQQQIETLQKEMEAYRQDSIVGP